MVSHTYRRLVPDSFTNPEKDLVCFKVVRCENPSPDVQSGKNIDRSRCRPGFRTVTDPDWDYARRSHVAPM